MAKKNINSQAKNLRRDHRKFKIQLKNEYLTNNTFKSNAILLNLIVNPKFDIITKLNL